MDDAPVQQPGPSLGEDLIVGAGPIAQFVYNDKKRTRDIYRTCRACRSSITAPNWPRSSLR